MKIPVWFIVAALLLITAAPARAQQSAHADIMDSKGQKIGTARLEQSSSGVRISLTASQLPPGTHGFHIHTVGKCDPPDFKTAGPHFNPDNKKHGLENPEGHHAGDGPNFTVGANGKAHFKREDKDVNLGADSHSLFSNGGTALIIHAKADDQKTDPAGNAGDRIACGFITK